MFGTEQAGDLNEKLRAAVRRGGRTGGTSEAEVPQILIKVSILTNL